MLCNPRRCEGSLVIRCDLEKRDIAYSDRSDELRSPRLVNKFLTERMTSNSSNARAMRGKV